VARPIYTGIDKTHPMVSNKLLDAADKPNPAPNDKFTMQQIIAESLLGATEPAFTDSDAVTIAELAIVMQMNFQEAQGLDPFFTESVSSTQARQSVVFRDRMLNPVAVALWVSIGTQTTLDQLLAKYSGVLRSVRTDDGGRALVYDPNCSDRSLESRAWRHAF
jgi:hypothetical protein